MAEGRDRERGLRIGPYVYPPSADQWDPDPRGHRPEPPPPEKSDPWSFDPNAKLPDDKYHGVRRAVEGLSRRRLAVIAAIAVGVVTFGAATAVLITSLAGSPDDATWADQAIPGGGASGVDQSRSAGPSPSGPTPSGSPAAREVANFAPITVEAEGGAATVKRRGAQVVSMSGASGGAVARFTDGSGEIEFRSVAIPAAGEYQITVYYAYGQAGQVRVAAGNAATTVALEGGSGCCRAAAATVNLPAGRQSITVSTSGDAPSIDRIVISQGP